MDQTPNLTVSDGKTRGILKRSSILQKILRNIKIRNRLIISFLILSLFPLILIGILTFNNSYRNVEQITTKYASKITYQVANNINYVFNQYIESFKLIALNSTILSDIYKYHNITDEYERIDVNNRIKLLLSTIVGSDKGIESVELCSIQGDRFYYHVPIIQENMRQSKLVKEATSNNGIVWQLSRKEEESDSEAYIIMARNLKIQFHVDIIGYAFMTIRRDFINKVSLDNTEGNKQYIVVTDENGYIISHPYTNEILHKFDKGILNKIDELENLRKDDGNIGKSFKISTNEGLKLITYDIVNKNKWKVINVADYANLMKSTTDNGILVLIAALICIVFSLIISIGVTNSISIPVKNLMSVMKKVGQGNLDTEIEIDANEAKDEYSMLSHGFNDMINKLKKSVNEAMDATLKEKELEFLRTEAELNALQQQINPHFLYNILESIYWNVQSKGDKETGKMITVLGNFFRSSITNGLEYVTIEEELNNVENYVTLQKIRFRDRLTVQWRVDPEIKTKYKTIKLILQPIIENAIVHGIENLVRGGVIRIKGYKEGEKIIFDVIDNGIGMSKEDVANLEAYINNTDKDPKKSIGVKNVHQRIKLYFGQGYGVKITSKLGIGTKVHIVLPALQ